MTKRTDYLSQAMLIFKETTPARPFCSDDPRTEGQYQLRRCEALQRRHIQPNTHKRVAWLCFDVDRPGAALDWHDRNLPPPTFVIENPRNGHAHLAYALTDPVPRSDFSRIKPLQYMAAVSEGIRVQVGADQGYSGGLMKTPGHPDWRTASYAGAYSLGELADWVTLVSPADLSEKARDREYAGLGRNCLLFELLRAFAYTAWRRTYKEGFEVFRAAVEVKAIELAAKNSLNPLPAAETRAIARSVSKWVWRHFSAEGFMFYQSAVGSRKGAAKRSAELERVILMASEGYSQRNIGAAVGVVQRTVGNWLRKAISDIPSYGPQFEKRAPEWRARKNLVF